MIEVARARERTVLVIVIRGGGRKKKKNISSEVARARNVRSRRSPSVGVRAHIEEQIDFTRCLLLTILFCHSTFV